LKLLFANGEGGISEYSVKNISPGEQDVLSEEFSSPGWPYLILDITIEGKIPANSICQVEIDSLSIETRQ
jgi:hypothetical protein